jgi:pilus assembly protein CpaD
MIRDPRDLVAPRGLGSSDATRRSTVMGQYEAGKPTAAQKNADQTTKITTEASQ